MNICHQIKTIDIVRLVESYKSMTSIQNGLHSRVDGGVIRKNDSIALAILDLSIGSIMNIDGTAIVLQRNDFIGIHSIPKTSPTSTLCNHKISKLEKDDDSIFHLVTIRGGNTKANANVGASITTVGILLIAHDMDSAVVARRYDPLTEEVSSNTVDEITISNLMEKVRNNQIDPQRIVSYRNIVSSTYEELWNDSTRFITHDFLIKIRNLQHGNKLVPGSYEVDNGDDDDNENDVHQTITKNSSVDGVSIHYPPIPVFAKANLSSDVKTVAAHRHLGTRRFLQTLGPALRTSFCFARNGINPANKALKHIIQTSYEARWEYLLGDVQLSFVLFLQLNCYMSYIYWRDAISMISGVDENCMIEYRHMYDALFHFLSIQIQSIDSDEGAFSEIDLSDDDCFLLPSLQHLLSTANNVSVNFEYFNTSLTKLKTAVETKFSIRYCETNISTVSNDCVTHSMECDHDKMDGGANFGNDEDDDLPVIVSSEEVEDSLSRSREYMNELDRYCHAPNLTDTMKENDRKLLTQHYPLLLAAMESSSGKEDIMMTCARVLYDAVDASLVREAAAYLEDVESKTMGNDKLL